MKYLNKGIVFLFALILGFTISCKDKNKQKTTTSTEKSKTLRFEKVTAPTVMTDQRERASYEVIHYWDNFDFTDTSYISKPEITEQAFVDFLYRLPHVPMENASEGIKIMVDKSVQNEDMFHHFSDLFEKYLWHPNSPMRAEEYYIPYLQAVIASDKLDPILKERPKYQLDLALKNRPGEVATDFEYTLENGKTHSLSKINSEYTVLFFSNPGCPACAEITEMMTKSSILSPLENKKENGRKYYTVLTIYPDEDITLWKEHLSDLPKNWINSYNKGAVIKNHNTYDLKAIPTLYLLDKDKRVIFKDVNYDVIEYYFYQMQKQNTNQ